MNWTNDQTQSTIRPSRRPSSIKCHVDSGGIDVTTRMEKLSKRNDIRKWPILYVDTLNLDQYNLMPKYKTMIMRIILMIIMMMIIIIIMKMIMMMMMMMIIMIMIMTMTLTMTMTVIMIKALWVILSTNPVYDISRFYPITAEQKLISSSIDLSFLGHIPYHYTTKI